MVQWFRTIASKHEGPGLDSRMEKLHSPRVCEGCEPASAGRTGLIFAGMYFHEPHAVALT